MNNNDLGTLCLFVLFMVVLLGFLFLIALGLASLIDNIISRLERKKKNRLIYKAKRCARERRERKEREVTAAWMAHSMLREARERNEE